MASVLVLAGVVALAVLMMWLPSYFRRHPEERGASGRTAGVIGFSDEVFHPQAHEARLAQEEQQRLVVPAPTPDGDKGIAEGRMRIDLDEARRRARP